MRTPFAVAPDVLGADFMRVPGPISLPAQSDPDTVGKHLTWFSGASPCTESAN